MGFRYVGVLGEAHEAYKCLNDAWLKTVVEHGYKDEWDAMRRETEWPSALREAWSVQNEALHHFYLLRDGPGGVLGPKPDPASIKERK